MRLGIVTCDLCPQLASGDQNLVPLLKEIGIAAMPVVWNNPDIDWKAYDGLLIRSVWDYHLHADTFAAWLKHLEANNVRTWNPIPVLSWNSHKFYLRDLQQRGVQIVPTLFMPKDTRDAHLAAKRQGWHSVVVKPAVSASGYRTAVLSPDNPEASGIFQDAAVHGDFLIQPFMNEVQQEGELSLIFFNQLYSHAVLKRPRQGEFRVQKEYGGDAIPFTPNRTVIATAGKILANASHPALYARVDGILVNGTFLLMELELIEPDLFLSSSPQATQRFAAALKDLI